MTEVTTPKPRRQRTPKVAPPVETPVVEPVAQTPQQEVVHEPEAVVVPKKAEQVGHKPRLVVTTENGSVITYY